MVVWAADIHADGRAQFGPLLLADLRLALSALASQSQHIEELATRIATLEEGLEPFADVAEEFEPDSPRQTRLGDDFDGAEVLYGRAKPNLGDFRRARTALSRKGGGDE